MYLISYDTIKERKVDEKELLEVIKSLHIEYKSKNPQCLRILKENVACFWIGIGNVNNMSILAYRQGGLYDHSQDTIVAYNPEFIRDEVTKIGVFYSNGKVTYRLKHRFIKFEDVLNELEYFIQNGCLSSNLNWYSS